MPIKVVIGANLGDEGKGLMTDYFASRSESPMVVRFNGGSQAGHTVATSDGKRHVFHHVGSGTLAGAATYLSPFFIVNPIMLCKELKELERDFNMRSDSYPNGNIIEPQRCANILIDGECMLSTPYDMILNEIAEDHLGINRHGSCGCGINETVTRVLAHDAATNVSDIFNNYGFPERLRYIRDFYVPLRLKEMGIATLKNKYKNLLNNDNIFQRYLSDCEEIKKFVQIRFSGFKTFIFEGAQGLLLDQGHEWFPHVTRSNTGLKNVMELIGDIPEINRETNDLEVVYVTRAYMTRHGNGPFPTQCPKPYPGIVDETNIPNEFQGTLRFGILDVDLLAESIKNDLKHRALWLDRPKVSLAVTCLDQCGSHIEYRINGTTRNSIVPILLQELRAKIGFDNLYVSYGPTRKDVVSQDDLPEEITPVPYKRKIEWQAAA